MLSPNKTTIKSRREQICVALTDQEVKIRCAKQELREKVADSNNFGVPVQSMFQSMQQDLLRNEDISYEDVQQIL